MLISIIPVMSPVYVGPGLDSTPAMSNSFLVMSAYTNTTDTVLVTSIPYPNFNTFGEKFVTQALITTDNVNSIP